MLCYTLGALLSFYLPPSLFAVGQGLYGVGCGLSMHAAPIYIAETAPAEIRGMLVSAKEFAIVVSMLSACCLLPAVCRLPSAVCCLLSAVCCLLSAVCCLLSAVCFRLFVVFYLLSAVCFLRHAGVRSCGRTLPPN
jgi:hypothetical protein